MCFDLFYNIKIGDKGGLYMQKTAVEKKKIISIYALFAFAIAIMVSGVAFSIYSLIYNIHFQVLSASVHGLVFALVITFLGMRYFISVRKLKVEVYRNTSQFSWNNFKKDKTKKTKSSSRR